MYFVFDNSCALMFFQSLTICISFIKCLFVLEILVFSNLQESMIFISCTLIQPILLMFSFEIPPFVFMLREDFTRNQANRKDRPGFVIRRHNLCLDV